MLRLLFLLGILILSVWSGILLMRHPGYLLVVFHPWMVQMPIWLAILATIIVFLLFYLLVNSLDRLQFAWYRMKNWLRFRRAQQSYSKTQHGLMALIEGRYKQAEQLLMAGISQSVEPLINYLAGAKAAQEQHAFDRRDQYIQKAYQIAPEADVAIGITQAELELAQNQVEHAAATLDQLRERGGQHPGVLKLLEKVYVRLGDWQNLLKMLPSLRRAKLITNADAKVFEKNIYCEILNQALLKKLDEIKAAWLQIPKAARKHPDVVTAYVKQLLRFPDTSKEIEELIRNVLKTHWQPQLVLIYAELPLTNLNRHLIIADAWLNLYGPQPEILLLLGRLCERLKLWGKAKDYYERCLKLGPNLAAALSLGNLLEELNEREQAMQVYRRALISEDRLVTSLKANQTSAVSPLVR